MEHRRTVLVKAPIDVIWELLADVEGWPRWTASMQRIDRLEPGPLAVGSRAKVQQPKGAAMEWTVTTLEPERNFTWQAHGSGMTFTAGHELSSTSEGVEVTLTFDLSGPLSLLGSVAAGGRIRRYVDMEAEGLGRAAERQAE